MDNKEQIWLEIKSHIQNSVEPDTFEQLIGKISGIYNIDSEYAYIVISDALLKYRLERFYTETFNKALAACGTSLKAKFVLQDEVETVKNQESQKKELVIVKKRNLKEDYVFENFIVGEANKEAYMLASKIAEQEQVVINPFYIFGDVGLGKTHLMTAIGHKILDRNPNLNVIFTTSQQFVDDFIKAKNRTQKDLDIINEFDEYYRSADVLMIDDIQFLESKQASQEEFFKIFDFLFENNKQIIVTSDRPASELDVMSRLKSRFAWGMQTDLKKPGLELRCDIIKNKLNELIDDSSKVPYNVLAFIATNFDQNVRELEGALRRYVTYCTSFGFEFSVESAQQALRSILPKEKTIQETDVNAEIQDIKSTVAKYFNIGVTDLVSQTRKKELVYARDITVYILKERYSLTLDNIGKYLGNRDHSTIAHSYNKILSSIQLDENIQEDYKNLCSNLDKLR